MCRKTFSAKSFRRAQKLLVGALVVAVVVVFDDDESGKGLRWQGMGLRRKGAKGAGGRLGGVGRAR